ncbi:MAG: hypothetical protein LBC85_06960 [Fibromonadaceae bacterium]|jgi:hypothetical protein|nr:hypothetical protein [Fibromonadaceae bacterium]
MSDLTKYSSKKSSLKTSRESKYFIGGSWGLCKLAKEIKAIKEEIKLDIELDKQDKRELNEVISALRRLHGIAMAKCKESNVEPEKCYIEWWIDC